MEIKKRNFFGENGLTQTSANYIANKAKEYIASISDKYTFLSFFGTNISLIGNKDQTNIKIGASDEDIALIPMVLQDEANAKALIAYLREAIKEKDRLLNEVRGITLNHEELFEQKPVRGEYLTESDILDSWSAEKLNKYFTLQAKAATYGKFVHPDGPYSKARAEFHKMQPTVAKVDGANTIVYHNFLTATPAVIESMFTTLQETQRGAQAEFNGMRHEIELALRKDKVEKDLKFETETRAYEAMVREKAAALEVEKNKLVDEILALKIVIPDNLKNIYAKITK